MARGESEISWSMARVQQGHEQHAEGPAQCRNRHGMWFGHYHNLVSPRGQPLTTEGYFDGTLQNRNALTDLPLRAFLFLGRCLAIHRSCALG